MFIFVSILAVSLVCIIGGNYMLGNIPNNDSQHSDPNSSFDEWVDEKKEKSDFLDAHIVFVIDGFGNYYYTYDEMIYVTQQLEEYEFWAYNLEQAIALDYLHCEMNITGEWSSEKADFLDERIVFIIDGFGNYYYTYDEMKSLTKHLVEYEYWAYNTEQAIYLGYSHP